MRYRVVNGLDETAGCRPKKKSGDTTGAKGGARGRQVYNGYTEHLTTIRGNTPRSNDNLADPLKGNGPIPE